METCPYCNKLFASSGTYCSIECLEKDLPFTYDETDEQKVGTNEKNDKNDSKDNR